MEKLRPVLYFVLFFLFSSAAFGQDVSSWYWKERFLAADANDDALLEKTELSKFPAEFVYFLDAANYRSTDANRDGFLSFNEMVAYRKAEASYRAAMEKRQIVQIEAANPTFKTPTVALLKTNVTVCKLLFANATWAMQNTDLLQELCKDAAWVNANADVLQILNRNLLWMASHPKQAKTLYGNKQFVLNSPELMGWRSNHIKFIRQYSSLEDFYVVEGYTEMIKLGKK